MQDFTSSRQIPIKGPGGKSSGFLWLRPIGLLHSSLKKEKEKEKKIVGPLAPGRAKQTARESMTSPLDHPLDTLEAHGSRGSNAPCSSGAEATNRDPGSNAAAAAAAAAGA